MVKCRDPDILVILSMGICIKLIQFCLHKQWFRVKQNNKALAYQTKYDALTRIMPSPTFHALARCDYNPFLCKGRNPALQNFPKSELH